MKITTLGPENENRTCITLHDVPGVIAIKEGTDERFGAYICIRANKNQCIPECLRSPNTMFVEDTLDLFWGWFSDSNRDKVPYGYRCWFTFMTQDELTSYFKELITIYNDNLSRGIH